MKHSRVILSYSKNALVAAALILSACSGNFATGTGMPNSMPPVNGASQPPYGQNGMPQGGAPSPQVSGSPGVAGTASYAISDAQTGFKCPSTIDGYSCLLRFNVPPSTPSPSPSPKTKGKKKAAHVAAATPTPSPSPSPTPTPSPDSSTAPDAPRDDLNPNAGANADVTTAPSGTPSGAPGASQSPSPSPTPVGAGISMKAEAMPKDAPAMYHTPTNTLDVVPLIMVHITPTGDFALDGPAVAQFTLPKEQIGERGFAVQLFQATTHKKRTDYKPIWTFDKSNLKDTTLTFEFTPPKMTITKGTTYVMVLYGDDKSKVSPSPSGSPLGSAIPSATPSAQPSALPSVVPTTASY